MCLLPPSFNALIMKAVKIFVNFYETERIPEDCYINIFFSVMIVIYGVSYL
jgi:hypothetical protein